MENLNFMNLVSIPLSRHNLRCITYNLRKSLNLENELYFPIVAFIELLPMIDNNFNYEIVGINEMKTMYGNTNTTTKTMYIREDVYNGAVQKNPRHRFTLCHELGHYIIHYPQNISYARGNVPIYRNPEWQANVFAAELMAPYNLIKNLSIDDIVNKCMISYSVASIQYSYIHNS